MPKIRLITEIGASPERCFDAARNIDLHLESMALTGERAIAGKITGLIGMGEQVTWRARHFGLMHEHTSRITVYDRPRHFRDEMTRGRFRTFRHDHYFDPMPSGTRMVDELEFESPGLLLGRLANRLFLTAYLEHLLQRRNAVVKSAAENGDCSGKSS